jgi:regulator of RNase E activity RraA
MTEWPLSTAAIDELRNVDTATVSNAMDLFDIGDPSAAYGYEFSSLELRCLTPDLPPMVGYAVTCTGDSTSPRHPERPDQRRALYEAIRDAGHPVVVVIQNVGPDRLMSNQFGDIMATAFQRLGAVGAITDGGIRDLDGIRRRAPGFQVFAPGAVASGGVFSIVDVGISVSICGMRIVPGDLLHGDTNGVVSIPQEIAHRIAKTGREILAYEEQKINFIKSTEFSLDGLERLAGHHPDEARR